MSDDTYHDKRAEFWRRHYEMGRDYAGYLAAAEPARAERWRALEARLPPVDAAMAARLSPVPRRVHILVYSGVWCGDCVRQGPMIQKLAEACPDAPVRFVERDQSVELQEELRVMGALRVPVVVFLSEDFWEIGRFGDRMLTSYRSKAQRELGAACDTGLVPAPGTELAAEMGEWLDIFERMLLMARLSPPLRARHGD